MAVGAHDERIARIRVEMSRVRCDLLAISPGDDFVYVTGFTPPGDERACALLLTQDRTVLWIPGLNADQAARHMSVPMFTYADADGPLGALREALRALGGSVRNAAVADDMRADHLLILQETMPTARFAPAAGVVAPVRMRKQPDEIDALRRSARTADAGITAAAAAAGAGMTEREIAAAAGAAMRDAGAEEVLFVSVAAGPNSALPHHHTSDRPLRPGDPVMVDLGGRLNHYTSDVTRMLHVGATSAKYNEVHGVVEDAVQSALAAVRPGAALADVDRAAREVITRAGYGERFIHRTGHGLGLTGHEPPSVTANNGHTIEVGMVFSIEPGIYLPDEFGVRLEEIVAVGASGPEILGGLSRALILVPGEPANL